MASGLFTLKQQLQGLIQKAWNAPFGNSYGGSFNGSNQYLQTTLSASLSGQFTIEAWIYRNISGNGTFLNFGDSNTSTGLEIYAGTSGTVTQIYSNGASQISGTNITTIGGWFHIAVTRDASNVVRMFINGV